MNTEHLQKNLNMRTGFGIFEEEIARSQNFPEKNFGKKIEQMFQNNLKKKIKKSFQKKNF